MCKATQSNEIPLTILKQNEDIFSNYIFNVCNFCVHEGKFPNIPKQANIISAFEKGYRGFKESYRPLSILPIIRKYMKNFFSK